MAADGTERSRRRGGKAIEGAYGDIKYFSANVGFCRNLCLKFPGGRW